MIIELKMGIAKSYFDELTPEQRDYTVRKNFMQQLMFKVHQNDLLKYNTKFENSKNDENGMEFSCYLEILTEGEVSQIYEKLKNERNR